MTYHFLDLYRWRITDPESGRRYVTRHVLTETDALELDSAAECMPSSHERRAVADDPVPNSTSTCERG